MRGARLPFRTTTAMGLTTRAEDERGGDRRAAGRRSVGIPERAARSRTRNEANGKTTAADQYRRTRRRARCARTVRGARSACPPARTTPERSRGAAWPQEGFVEAVPIGRHGGWRRQAAMGVGGGGQLAAAVYVSVSSNSAYGPLHSWRVRPPAT